MLGFISINLGKPCSVRFNDGLGVTGDNAKPFGENMKAAIEPIYFVRHIDGTFSVADPQPTASAIFDLPRMNTPNGAPLPPQARPLLDSWADAACVRFVSRSHGEATTGTVSRDDLLQLIVAARNDGRETCALALGHFAAASDCFGKNDIGNALRDMAAFCRQMCV